MDAKLSVHCLLNESMENTGMFQSIWWSLVNSGYSNKKKYWNIYSSFAQEVVHHTHNLAGKQVTF